MATEIYYICDLNAQEFYFFERYNDAKKKEGELTKKYGGKGLEFGDKILMVPPFAVQFKKLKNYYGTIWLQIKWTEKSCLYQIYGRFKDISKNEGYSIKKIVLTSYQEYQKRFEDNN